MENSSDIASANRDNFSTSLRETSKGPSREMEVTPPDHMKKGSKKIKVNSKQGQISANLNSQDNSDDDFQEARKTLE
ncbi:hypothetical protein A2U01_0013747, partial [Trifolium medium]|nr:hypothetical protein [Trifolium medium]